MTYTPPPRTVTNADIDRRMEQLRECGARLKQLKGDIVNVIQAQRILVEAHDIIGSADPVMLSTLY